jgi:antitoxin (DNA-binding transcriptional repressor) of toxin-antitoxin stability system
MTTMSVTDFARNLRKVFDKLEHGREVIVLTRNKHQIARIIPGLAAQTALEAMSDLYRTIPDDAGKTWVKESRISGTLSKEVRNRWDS